MNTHLISGFKTRAVENKYQVFQIPKILYYRSQNCSFGGKINFSSTIVEESFELTFNKKSQALCEVSTNPKGF